MEGLDNQNASLIILTIRANQNLALIKQLREMLQKSCLWLGMEIATSFCSAI
jgi:hypothetical protein